MKRALLLAALVTLLPATAARADGNRIVLTFETMYGVDGPFVHDASIRGVLGDELLWDIRKVKGSLSADGPLVLQIKGLVFSNDPSVPPNLRGTNDETSFRALVSCLVENGYQIGTVKGRLDHRNHLHAAAVRRPDHLRHVGLRGEVVRRHRRRTGVATLIITR